MQTTKFTRILSLTAAATFVVVAGAAGYLTIGLPPVVIVGGSGLVAMVLWSRTYLKSRWTQRSSSPCFCSRWPLWKCTWPRNT